MDWREYIARERREAISEEKERADAEKERADTEKERADAAEAEVMRLRALLEMRK